MRRWIILLGVGCLQSTDPGESMPNKETSTPMVVLFPEGGKPVQVRVEVAATTAERSRGLMFRNSLDADAGMIFIFDRTEVQSFWMKNTKIPLDMIFIDESFNIVGLVEGAEPMTLDQRSVGLPSRYVLEVNAGFAQEHGIAAGLRVELRGVL